MEIYCVRMKRTFFEWLFFEEKKYALVYYDRGEISKQIFTYNTLYEKITKGKIYLNHKFPRLLVDENKFIKGDYSIFFKSK